MKKGSILKERICIFPFRVDPFFERSMVYRKAKSKSQKLSPL